jgi:hypothetical protein
MGQYKKFSQELFDSNDSRARSAVLSHFNALGLYCAENADRYGPDLLLYSGFKPSSFIEVEIKHTWKAGQDKFPWSTVQLPERKGKFRSLGLPVLFFILRQDAQVAVVFSDNSVRDESLLVVPNKRVADGEKFFGIPIEEVTLVQLRGYCETPGTSTE